MGLIDRVFGALFGSGGNLIQQTAEVFVENAEKGAARGAVLRGEALAQYAQEFAGTRRGLFDRVMDAINRLPRPALALGTLALFVAAMADPIWFATRMQGMALVPEPLWWLLGAIVSFYFGARHQLKNQQFQRQVAASVALTPQVLDNIQTLASLRSEPEATQKAINTSRSEPVLTQEVPSTLNTDPKAFTQNAALQDWARSDD